MIAYDILPLSKDVNNPFLLKICYPADILHKQYAILAGNKGAEEKVIGIARADMMKEFTFTILESMEVEDEQ